EVRGANFYCLRGPVLIFSGEEAMLRQAIDLEQGAAADAEPALSARLRAAGADKAGIALGANPPALDAPAEANPAAAADPDQGTARKTFAACWKAVDEVVVSVDLGRDLSLSLALRGRPELLPPGVRRFLAETARPSELWRAFPDNALFALAVRFD